MNSLIFWDIIFYTQPHFLYILKTMYRVQSKTNFLIMDRVKNRKWEQNTPFLTWTKQPLIFSNSWAPINCTAGDWNHIIVFIYSWPSWHSNFKCLDLGLPFSFLFFFFSFLTIEYIQSNMHWSFPDPSLSILESLQKYPNLDAFANQIIPKDSTQLARPQLSNTKNTSWPTRIASTQAAISNYE